MCILDNKTEVSIRSKKPTSSLKAVGLLKLFRRQIKSRRDRERKWGLLFFVRDIILVEIIYLHGFLHMTRPKELQEVFLELIREV